MLVAQNGWVDGLCPDGHEAKFGQVTKNVPRSQPVATRPVANSSARGSSGLGTSLLKVLSGVAKVANVALGGNNNGGGGGGYDNGSGGFDTSGFSAGLQQQTWSSTSGAAGDPIQ